MITLVFGLAIFLGIHFVPTRPALRARLLARWGEKGYKLVFSLASAVGLVLIVAGFAGSGDRLPLFNPVPAARDVAPFAMAMSFVLFAAANLRGHLRAFLKHPMLLGLVIWSTVHLLANGDRAGTTLFGAFLAYGLIDLVSAIRRGAVKTFQPTAAHDVIAVVGGVVVALGVMTLHRLFFGIAVVQFGV
jgi:uncharacterized membrane protein